MKVGVVPILFACLLPSAAPGAEVETLLSPIKAVGREGAGNVAAQKAWRELVRSGPEVLPAVLSGFDQADPTAANWLRTAADTIAERAIKAHKKLPAAELEAFILKREHDGAARRLAYEWLVRVDATARGRLLPGMLFDPSLELRRDAVDLAIKDAEHRLDQKDQPAAIAAFRRALSGARDRDQVDLLAKKLKPLGVSVDLPAHFGLVQRWLLIGPFDNTGGVGFKCVYEPEKVVMPGASHQGKKGADLRWMEHKTGDPYGLVDLNKAIGKYMGAVAYAYATVTSPADQAVQIRAGSNNAVKIFLNGKQIFFREEYHHGMQMDQHVGAGMLKAGRNEILIKLCQNEQSEEWAQTWSFQLRVCDAVGGAVPMSVTTEKPQAQSAEGKVPQ